jgi:hypothetical protein
MLIDRARPAKSMNKLGGRGAVCLRAMPGSTTTPLLDNRQSKANPILVGRLHDVLDALAPYLPEALLADALASYVELAAELGHLEVSQAGFRGDP